MNFEIKDGILLGSKEKISGELIVPDGVKKIAAHAFWDNHGVTSVVCPSSLERIGGVSFAECCDLVRAVIPEAAKISTSAFYNCDLLITNLSIRQWKERYGISKLNYAVNYIRCYRSGDPFFDSVKEENNKYIKRSFPRLIDTLSEDAVFFVNYVTREIQLDLGQVEDLLDKFSGNIEAVAVLLDYKHSHFSPEFLEKYAAEQTEKELGLRPRTIAEWRKTFDLSDDGQGGIIIKKYWGKDTEVVIPDTIGDRRVTGIGKYAFRPPTDRHGEPLDSIIRAVYIPDSVTVIGEGAFLCCKYLEEIKIPNSVVSIGCSAFYNCRKLKDLRLPRELTYIADGLFYSCELLSGIEIPSSVTSIGYSAFCYCTSLTSIKIPDSVKHIGNNAFARCTALTEITLPGSLTEVGDYLFLDCENLTRVDIEKGITAIPDHMFAYCRNLAEVQLPDGVVSLGHHAFYDCGALSHIKLPDTVRDISKAFNNCWGLEELTVPEGVTEIAIGAFFKAVRLKKITLPDTITEIGTAAFEQSGVTSIKIPSGVTAIRESTFRCCDDLVDVELPASVTYIDPGAFYLCSKDMVISAPRSSYAIKFARESGIKFKELPV